MFTETLDSALKRMTPLELFLLDADIDTMLRKAFKEGVKARTRTIKHYLSHQKALHANTEYSRALEDVTTFIKTL